MSIRGRNPERQGHVHAAGGGLFGHGDVGVKTVDGVVYCSQSKSTWETGGKRVPRKIRELARDLLRAGFINRGGKGSHRNFVHPSVPQPITLSGKDGDDALQYQEKAVRLAIEESRR